MQHAVRTWIPLDFLSKGKDGRILVRGIASTEHRDREGDVIRQDGLDWSAFLKSGWFNDNHSKKTTDVVGYPTKVYPVEVDDGSGRMVKATAVEGYLLDTPRAIEIAELAAALKNTPRRLGLSVEGPPPKRDRNDPREIKSAAVWNVAVTNCPVNPYSNFGLVKSMRALDALRKAATTGSIAPLMPESLGLRLTLPAEVDPIAQVQALQKMSDDWRRGSRARRRPRLTKSQALETIHRRFPRASAAEADRILALARRMGEP